MLQLRGFAGTPDKVKLVEFHPVQPWIAFADKSDNVRVWDWTTQQILHDVQLGGADDEGSIEAAINQVSARDPAFIPNPSALSSALTRVASGKVRQVSFLDLEVAYWQTAIQHYMVNGSSINPPSAVKVHALDGTRLLVVVCENKVLLNDLNTRKSFEVQRAVLDNKSPTCVTFLFRGGHNAPGGQPDADNLMTSPVLAIGCSDGSVRLLHLATLRVIGKLVGSHKATITCLLTVPSKAAFKTQEQQQAAAGAQQKQPSSKQKQPKQQQQQDTLTAPAVAAAQPSPEIFIPSHDLVIGGDSAGGLYVWEPFRQILGSADREVGPALAFTGHAGEVWALCLTPGPEDPQLAAAKVFTAGADHRLVAWDASTFREAWRTKLDAKSPITSLAYSHRYFNLSGAHALLATVNGPGVVAAYTLADMPPERGLRACANLAGLVPPGSKKVPKAYCVAVSPVRPNLAAVGANTGMAFMTFDRMYPLPVAALPLHNLAEAHESPALRLPQDLTAVSYIAHMGDALWLVSCTALEKGVGGVQQLVPQVVSQQHIGAAPGKTGRAIMGVSGSGQYISCCWPASRSYVVYYKTLAGTWSQVDSGLGVDLVWHSQRDVFAVLEEPLPPAPSAKGKKKWGKEDPKVAAAEAAVIAATLAAATVVRIKALDGLGISLVCQQVALSGDIPVALHGGPLLAVALKRMTSSGAELSGEEASPVLQFYSWNGINKVGPELPEPSVVSWDPTLRYLALAYQRQVQLMRVQPQMEVLGSLPVSGTSAVCWGVRQLYLTTPTSVLLAFVAAEEKAAGGFTLLDMEPSGGARKGSASTLQFIQLAGLTGTAATSSLRAGSSGATASLPGPGPRPAGPLALLGPRRGNLWLANSLGQPVLLPLTHPGIRARCLCAQGDLVGAVAVGRRSMAPSCHDSLASFLHLQGGVPGAHLALMGLQGLSLEMESELCMATGQWRRACVCCEALLRSFSDRTTLGTAEAFAQGDPAGARSANDSNLLTAAGVTGVTAQLATAAQLAAAAQASTPEAPAAKQQQQLWGIMGFGGLFVDNYQLPQDKEEEEPDKQKDPLANGRIAWGAPLRHNWRFENAPKRASNTGQGEADSTSTSLGAAAADGLVAAAATTAAAAQPPPASALSLTMRLVEGSQAAGITDVTRRASQLLLAHRDLLSPSQLARLAAKMAEVGMYTDINGLVDSSVASGSHHGQALGFVAAALTGDLQRLQRALQQSGTDALAALQANTYRLPTGLATERCWNSALQRIASNVAAHPTNSYAYYMVSQSGL